MGPGIESILMHEDGRHFSLSPSLRGEGHAGGVSSTRREGQKLARSISLPLTLTLSPLKEWGEGNESITPPSSGSSGPRQHLVTDARQRCAAARVLDAGPGEAGIEIIAAVHVDGAGVDLGAEACGGIAVGGPDRGSEAVAGIVHEADGFLVVFH